MCLGIAYGTERVLIPTNGIVTYIFIEFLFEVGLEDGHHLAYFGLLFTCGFGSFYTLFYAMRLGYRCLGVFDLGYRITVCYVGYYVPTYRLPVFTVGYFY